MSGQTPVTDLLAEDSFRQAEKQQRLREILFKPQSRLLSFLETLIFTFSPLTIISLLQAKLALSSTQFLGLILALSLPLNYLLYRLNRAEKRLNALLELNGTNNLKS